METKGFSAYVVFFIAFIKSKLGSYGLGELFWFVVFLLLLLLFFAFAIEVIH